MEFGIALWLLFGIFSAVIGNSKNRNGCGWFVLGCLFGPFALIAVAAMPALQREPGGAPAAGPVPEYSGTDRAPCRWCLEPVRIGAVICPHCRRDEPHEAPAVPAPEPQPAAAPTNPGLDPPTNLGVAIFVTVLFFAVVILAIVTKVKPG